MIPTLTILFNVILESLAGSLKQEKRNKRACKSERKKNNSIFVMTYIYTHRHKTCECTKVATRYWITIDKRMLEPIRKKIPHIQEQRRSSNKIVRGGTTMIKSNPIPTRWTIHKLEIIIPNKFSVVKNLSPTSGFPAWGLIKQTDKESPGNLTLKFWLSEFDCRTSTGLGEAQTQLLEAKISNLVHTTILGG